MPSCHRRSESPRQIENFWKAWFTRDGDAEGAVLIRRLRFRRIEFIRTINNAVEAAGGNAVNQTLACAAQFRVTILAGNTEPLAYDRDLEVACGHLNQDNFDDEVARIGNKDTFGWGPIRCSAWEKIHSQRVKPYAAMVVRSNDRKRAWRFRRKLTW